MYPTWESYQEVMKEKRLLSLNFTTLSDYLWLLRASAECLQKLVPRALLYLAAAVSDFYIPQGKHYQHFFIYCAVLYSIVPSVRCVFVCLPAGYIIYGGCYYHLQHALNSIPPNLLP